MIWLSFKSTFTICFPHGNSQLWPTHHYHKSHLPSQLLSLNFQHVSPSVASSLANDSTHWFLFNDIRLFFVTSARDVFFHCSMISSKPEDTICLSFTNNWFHHSKCCQCSALAFQWPFLYSSCLHSPEHSLSTVDWLWPEIWGPNSCSITGNCYSTVTITFLNWMDQTFLAGSPP